MGARAASRHAPNILLTHSAIAPILGSVRFQLLAEMLRGSALSSVGARLEFHGQPNQAIGTSGYVTTCDKPEAPRW
jgi:hypothetical protein